MKEIILEDIVKQDLTKEELDNFFSDEINKAHINDFKVYERNSSKQVDLFNDLEKRYDISQKDKLTKYYKDKDNVLKKVDRNLKNTIVKYSLITNEIEIAYYKEGFQVPTVDLANCSDESEMIASAMFHDNAYWKDREYVRNFRLNKETEMIEKINDNASIAKLVKSIHSGDVRAKKNFYDYALNYPWEYFCTFTFADAKIKNDRQQIKTQWRYFVLELQKINKDVKVLSVVEEHKNGGYHLHALISDIDLLLVPARNNDKKCKYYRDFLYTKLKNQIFNCKEWSRGFNTIVCIEPQSRQKKIINYLTKYITKKPVALFGERRFYRTRNYDVRNTEILNCSEGEIEKLTKENGMYLRKDDLKNNVKFFEIKVNRAVSKNMFNKIIKNIGI